jgi:ribosomal-protein-alanine N-acetyltransferase
MAEPQILFRQLDYTDIEQLLAIERLSFAQPWSKESYAQELLANQRARFFGIFIDAFLVAFGGYWLIIDEGHISNIAVHPDYRRHGFGELLMRQMMAICQTEGGLRMTLEVRRSNVAAQRLYHKLGFKMVGSRPQYYDLPPEDALIMWLMF